MRADAVGRRRLGRAAVPLQSLLAVALGATLLLAPQGRASAAPLEQAGAADAVAALAPTGRNGVPPTGFSDVVAISGLTEPTTVAFAADGRVFVGEKSGLIKVVDSLSDTSATVFADLRTQVHNFWDRGLLGLALDPQFPARPYVYVFYTYDALPGGTAPRWGTAGVTGDGCPNPPGATVDGCLVQARLSRLTAAGDRMTGAEQVLVTGWCQQFPSHSAGALAFGPDGALYASAGEGASFNYADYGQTKNPCGDPPSPAGTSLTPPTAQGGALRTQSVRRPTGASVTLGGTIIRVDPNTGAGLPGNPFASNADANARRIIAYGLRNPFRFDIRPGTEQLWIGDVGWNAWEEIDRIADINDGVAENFGWPCYEGNGRQAGYDGADLNSCESLYAVGQRGPFFTYNHAAKVVSSDSCPTGSSSVSGVAFENGSNYPPDYDGALFFADASRGCIWVMRRAGGVDPTAGQLSQFVGGAGRPVQVLTGPGGDIFYVDLDAGQVRRVVYNGANHPPTAVVSANPTSGPAPLTVAFDGSGSSDLDPGDSLSYAWDLDGDGQLDDSTAVAPTRTYTSAGTVTVRLRVTDSSGASDTRSVTITVGAPPNDPPVPVIDAPTSGVRWKVGDGISFSGHATDAQDGTLSSARLSWSVQLNHCPSNCHTHPVQTFTGVSTGTFAAPDHEYPSSLSLVLTATDAAGAQASVSRRLDPATVDLTFATSPSGLQLDVGPESVTAPATRTVIVGSSNSVSAPSPQTLGNTSMAFSSWSDGGARVHNLIAPATPTTYTATFAPCGGHCFFLTNGTSGGVAQVAFWDGQPATEVIVGDWNVDGVDTFGFRVGSSFVLKNSLSPGPADVSFSYGLPSDEVLVGDWNGDGRDTLGVRRGQTYYLRNSLGGGPAEITFVYGRSTDEVLVGDWNADGRDTLAVRRGQTYYLRNSLGGGAADTTFVYGRATDEVLVGDWNGDGRDTLAVRRGQTYYLKNSFAGGAADITFTFGLTTDEAHIGDWNRDGKDTLGIRR
jgi:glucose/arabinose dehydrogenase/PKD repeat protein